MTLQDQITRAPMPDMPADFAGIAGETEVRGDDDMVVVDGHYAETGERVPQVVSQAPAPAPAGNAPEGFVPYDPSEGGDAPPAQAAETPADAVPAQGAEARIQEVLARAKAAEDRAKAADERLGRMEAEQQRREQLARMTSFPENWSEMSREAQAAWIAQQAESATPAPSAPSAPAGEPEAPQADPEILVRLERAEREAQRAELFRAFHGASSAQVDALLELREKHHVAEPKALLSLAKNMKPDLFPDSPPKRSRAADAAIANAPGRGASEQSAPRDAAADLMQEVIQARGRNKMRAGAAFIEALNVRAQ